MISSFGFIMTRHVNSKKSNTYWQEAYRCIRAIYPSVLILIVDDNSNKEYLQMGPESPILSNIWLIESEYAGRGELLAYYYFWKYKPFKKAVVIHDSVFIQSSFKTFFSSKIEEIDTARFLWHFPHFFDQPEKEETYLRALEKAGCPKHTVNDLIYFHRGLQKEWLGCFGVMSVISLTFLTNLVEKYGFFHWFQIVFSRNERYVMERVFAVLCCIEDRKACKSLLGDIYETPRNFHFEWDDYLKGEWKKEEQMTRLPLLKVWSGR